MISFECALPDRRIYIEFISADEAEMAVTGKREKITAHNAWEVMEDALKSDFVSLICHGEDSILSIPKEQVGEYFAFHKLNQLTSEGYTRRRVAAFDCISGNYATSFWNLEEILAVLKLFFMGDEGNESLYPVAEEAIKGWPKDVRPIP